MAKATTDVTASIIDDILNESFGGDDSTKVAEPVAAPVTKKAGTVTCNKGQKKYSTLLPSHKKELTRDHAVSCFNKKDIHADMVAHIPTKDKNYVPNFSFCEAVLTAWEMNDKVLIHGAPGTGKSSGIEYLCALTGRPFIRINASRDMDSSHFFGQLVVEGGATVWKDGPVTEAVKMGAVLLWDEWDVTEPGIAMSMQYLLEEDGRLHLKEKPGTSEDKFITPHPDFRIVCCGNTIGQGDNTSAFAGTSVQNTASLDRFGTVIKADYLPADQEVSLVTKKTGIDKPDARKMVRLANLIRKSYKEHNISLTFSPRTLIFWGRKAKYWSDMKSSLLVSFGYKLNDVDYKELKHQFHKVYSEELS